MRQDQALWDERPPHGSGPQGGSVSSKDERAKGKDWVPDAYRILAKVFNAKPFTLEQEKRLKAVLNRAQSKEVALEAIDLMWNEGVTYPSGFHLRTALDRVHMRLASQRPLVQDSDAWEDPEWRGVPPCCLGSFDEIGFVHWWKNHANEQSKNEARRAASGLDVMARWVKAASA